MKCEADAFRLGGSGISTARLATLFIMNTLSSQATKGTTLVAWINKLTVHTGAFCPTTPPPSAPSCLARDVWLRFPLSRTGRSASAFFAPVCVHCLCMSRQALFANNGVACVWLLQTLLSDQASLKRLLFETEDEPTRNALAKLLSQVRGVLWLCPSRCASCPS